MRKLFLLSLLVLIAPVVLAACGGSDEADVDPEQVLRETFNNDETVSSGTLSIAVGGSVEGDQSGSGEVSVSGAFQGDADDPAAIPQVDLTGTVSGEASGINVDASGGLTITEDNAYVTYQDTSYELGSEIFDEFKALVETAAEQAGAGAGGDDTSTDAQSFSEQCITLLEQAGGNTAACDTVDPFSWFTLTNEGEVEIEGAQTIQINGSIDIGALVDNINATIEAADIPGATEISEEDVQDAEAAISDFSFDVYSGVDDRLLRGLDLNLTIDASAIPDSADSGVTSVTLNLDTRIGAINEAQMIEAPADPQPLDDLLGQFGLSAADLEAALSGYSTQLGLGGIGSTGFDDSGLDDSGLDSSGSGLDDLGTGGSGGGGGGGGGGSADIEAANEFFDCISKAKTPEDLQACNKLAP